MKTMKTLPIRSIKPDRNQPRKSFDRETLNGMSETIKKHGVVEPIHIDDKKVIITGERRWRASKIAGMKKIPVIIHKKIDNRTRLEMQLIEDIQSEDIPLPERDKAWKRLFDMHKSRDPRFTKESLAKVIGVSEWTIRAAFDRLGIVDHIPKTVKAKVSADVITETRFLPKEERIPLIKKAAKLDLGGRQVREIVKVMKKAPKKAKAKILEEKDLTPIKAQEIAKKEELKEAVKRLISIGVRGEQKTPEDYVLDLKDKMTEIMIWIQPKVITRAVDSLSTTQKRELLRRIKELRSYVERFERELRESLS